MKNFHIHLLLLFVIASIPAHSQLRRMIYHIEIVSRDGEKLKGRLVTLQDSAIQVLTRGKKPVDTLISIKRIQKLSLRRRNAPERAFGTGFLIGAGTGVLLGYASYSPGCDGSAGFCIDFGPGLSALVGGVVGGLGGGILGLAIGSSYKKYMIFGDQPSYDAFRRQILAGPKSTLQKPPIIANQ